MTRTDIAFRALAAFVAFNLVMIFAPATPYGLLFAVALSAALLLIDFRNGLLLVSSSFVLVLLLEAFVRLSGGAVISAYYRAHEMLAEETRYRAGQRIEMTEAHGDLLAIDPRLDRGLGEPRPVLFQTDARGFRNEQDAAEHRLIVVGDSYVVGIGNTQADTLTAQLTSQYGIPTYNMGFPAGPFQYANTVAAAREELGDDACVVVMMFEGNDFQIIDPAELAVRTATPRGAQDFLKAYLKAIKAPFESSKVFFGLYTQSVERLRASFDGGDGQAPVQDLTLVRNVAGKPMVFLKGYADVVRREGYDDYGYIQDQFVRATPDLILFVPDKYRVYAPLLDEAPASDLPHAQIAHLAGVAGALNVPVLDLTAPLVNRSRELLPQGLLTYWRDDTHWNRLGIEVAAREIAQVLPVHTKSACRDVATVYRMATGVAANKP